MALERLVLDLSAKTRRPADLMLFYLRAARTAATTRPRRPGRHKPGHYIVAAASSGLAHGLGELLLSHRWRMLYDPVSKPTLSKPPTFLTSRQDACSAKLRSGGKPWNPTSAVCRALVSGEAQTASTFSRQFASSLSPR